MDDAETTLFNQAVAQFAIMMQGHPVLRPAEVVFLHNPRLLAQYEDCRRRFGNTDEIWVFHGTRRPDVVDLIIEHGFRVGGVDAGVPVANGTAHGNGVYSATGPGTPLHSYGGGKNVFLARALVGRHGARHSDDCDTWSPTSDWKIFRRGYQLLPFFLLRFP